MQMIDVVQPTEASYKVILTQTEVDIIATLVGNIHANDITKHAPTLWAELASIRKQKFRIPELVGVGALRMERI